MDALEAILSRRSTRKYKDQIVELDLIEKVIEAGRNAPSGGNSQTTHLIVITNKDVLEHLAELAMQEFSKMEITEGMYRSLCNSITASKRGHYYFHYHAPVLILTANKIHYGNHMADCVCALENMMIACNALDLGSCYINQLNWLNENENMNAYLKTLGLLEDERVYASMVLGYPDTDTGLPQRNPIEKSGNPVTFIK